MTELTIILMTGFSTVLFAIGGTGHKWARRYVIPMIFAGGLTVSGVPLSAVISSCGLLVIALCLPYGDSVPKRYQRTLTGVVFSIPSLTVGFSIWAVVLTVVTPVLFALSQHKDPRISKIFTWKLCELGIGFLISASFIGAVLSRG